ncbi:TetR/AcrR family transcriptional regulator [Caulobacter sp. KR2-114]|uniref:TetR/AcrR family transcriptional regulator n=1 Tax=Caulobacter sp. KR2-114 TaxID=3400912 RepID=UPI003C0BFADF
MGQKEKAQARPRGRPREYDPDAALQRATEVFWKTGYAGASLDEISAAAGMNRPSLRAAFGDKHALYLKALGAYWDAKFAALGKALDAAPLETALMNAYEAALDLYFSADEAARGCFVVGTALTEAPEDAEIQRIVTAGFRRLDADFEARLRAARAAGELSGDADPEALAVLATATMHTLAVRARAGATRDDLLALARRAVGVICR